jgi:superfamily I DNA/RNA helicase
VSTPGMACVSDPMAQVLTMHRAKGLEFDYVFLMAASDEYAFPARASRV